MAVNGGKTRGETVNIRLVCRNLPGIRFQERGGPVQVREPVYLGIQRGTEVIEAVPADRGEVTYNAPLRVVKGKDGRPNFLGRYAHGTPDDRFLYLSWGEVMREGKFEMFRRAKVKLAHLDWKTVQKAINTQQPLVAELSLTDEQGGPLCATVRDQHIKWRL